PCWWKTRSVSVASEALELSTSSQPVVCVPMNVVRSRSTVMTLVLCPGVMTCGVELVAPAEYGWTGAAALGEAVARTATMAMTAASNDRLRRSVECIPIPSELSPIAPRAPHVGRAYQHRCRPSYAFGPCRGAVGCLEFWVAPRLRIVPRPRGFAA